MSRWDGIDEFVAVASSGGFASGAKLIGMSPTHVSRAVMALEHRLEAQLFHRTTRTVRLTDTGRAFLTRCEQIVQERDEAFALVGAKGEPQGELRVTCSTTIGELFVAPVLRRFATQHPRLSLTIELSNRVIDLVAEDFDLAVRTGQTNDARLTTISVASRRLYTCAAPSYLAQAGRPESIEDLSERECVIGTATTWHFKVDGKARDFRPNGRFRCNSGHAVIEACVAGMGVCQLPDFYILPFLREGLVELVLERAQADDQPILAVYPRRRHLLPKVQYAIEALKQELSATIHRPV